MRLTPFVAILAIGCGAYYGKLLHDREVASGWKPPVVDDKLADKDKVKDKDPPPPPPPSGGTGDPVKRPPRKNMERTPVLSAEDEDKLAEARGLVAQGRFDAAQDATRRVRGGADLELAAAQLGEKAQLFAALTKAVQPHAFAGATDLIQVTLASGIAHTARIVKESPQTVVLALADGRELEVRPERIAKREKLAADGWAKQVRAEVDKKKADLPKDAGALEVYHVACEAYEVAAGDIAALLLERSLGLDGGDAIIDVYGFGDLELLHRAQSRIRRAALAANPGAIAEGRRPRAPRVRPVEGQPPAPPSPPPQVSDKPPPTNVPGPETPPEVPPPPPPGETPGPSAPPSPPPPPAEHGMDFEKLEMDGRWIDAHEAYKLGVDNYKAGFQGRSSTEKQKLKAARTALEKARQLMDQLPTEMTPDAAQSWDSFSARVNEILRAIKKQMAATGS